MNRRFQFSVRTLLAIMLAVACFFAGMAWQRELGRFEATEREYKLEMENRSLVSRLKQILYSDLRDRRQAALQDAVDNPDIARQPAISFPKRCGFARWLGMGHAGAAKEKKSGTTRQVEV